MKLPKKLDILGRIIDIRYPYKFTERSDLSGQADLGAEEIRIQDTDEGGEVQCDNFVVVTLIHEILHCIDMITGHNYFNSIDGEKALDGVSSGIYQLLKVNKTTLQNFWKGETTFDVIAVNAATGKRRVLNTKESLESAESIVETTIKFKREITEGDAGGEFFIIIPSIVVDDI